MIRGAIQDTSKGEEHFRWRNPDVSRIENLSDIVFALTITLIAAPSVPQSFTELTSMWRDMLATGFCFAIILIIWDAHYRFFRRYDLEDGPTIILNSILLFLVITFAYPLKFILLFLVRMLTLDFGGDESVDAVMSLEQGRWAIMIYSLGYASIFLVFSQLYRRALSQAARMDLSEAEVILTKSAIEQTFVQMGVALFVVIAAFFTPTFWAGAAGFLFFLIWPLSLMVTKREKKALKKISRH